MEHYKMIHSKEKKKKNMFHYEMNYYNLIFTKLHSNIEYYNLKNIYKWLDYYLFLSRIEQEYVIQMRSRPGIVSTKKKNYGTM